MKLSFDLQKRVVDFLESLPSMSDGASRRALIQRAGLDPELQNQIKFDRPPAEFFPLLVPIFSCYGNLNDGRNPIVALLEATKSYIGKDRKDHCSTLIQEIEQNQISPEEMGVRVLLTHMRDDLEVRKLELQQGSSRTSKQWFVGN